LFTQEAIDEQFCKVPTTLKLYTHRFGQMLPFPSILSPHSKTY